MAVSFLSRDLATGQYGVSGRGERSHGRHEWRMTIVIWEGISKVSYPPGGVAD
jgi:hypothetical protein